MRNFDACFHPIDGRRIFDPMELQDGKLIVLFDGVCNLCNRSVQFVIKRDRNDRFRFASLQGETGRKLMAERGIDSTTMDSIILIDPGVAWYVKSDAALEISRNLKGYGWMPLLFGWLPRQVRDAAYDLVATNRYRWFGKQEHCMVPSPELRARFLD